MEHGARRASGKAHTREARKVAEHTTRPVDDRVHGGMYTEAADVVLLQSLAEDWSRGSLEHVLDAAGW